MTRYKLVQEYPGSQELGTIVHNPHRSCAYVGDEGSKYKMNNSKNIKNCIFFSREYIENYPKFWKKL